MDVSLLKKLIENPKYTKKKIQLQDGRQLSYSECGNIESGMPVLFCFGLMTSSIAIVFAHYAALQTNLRIVAVDYPGIGESTFQKNRILQDWAKDISEFCDQVFGKYSSVRLLGHSLGALHVLALLADKTFKPRVVRTVLLSPWVQSEKQEYNPVWLNLARNLPEVFQSSIIPTVITNLSSGSLGLAEWSNPQLPQFQAVCLVKNYASRHGQAGNEQMVRLALSKKQPPLPEKLRSPIIIYHGKNDRLVLEKSVSELTRILKIRNCKVSMIMVENGDHNNVLADPKNLADVFGSIVGDPGCYHNDDDDEEESYLETRDDCSLSSSALAIGGDGTSSRKSRSLPTPYRYTKRKSKRYANEPPPVKVRKHISTSQFIQQHFGNL